MNVFSVVHVGGVAPGPLDCAIVCAYVCVNGIHNNECVCDCGQRVRGAKRQPMAAMVQHCAAMDKDKRDHWHDGRHRSQLMLKNMLHTQSPRICVSI